MRVGDVMTTEVLTVTGGESLKAAARLMVEAGVSGLPVIDDGGSLIGIITEADFVRRQAREDRGRLLNVVLQRRDPVSGATTVGEVMTPHPIVIYPEATVTEAARVMLAHRVKRLPVVDDVGRLVGVVSRADLMSAFTIPDEELADTVRQDVLKRVLLLDPGVARCRGEGRRRLDQRRGAPPQRRPHPRGADPKARRDRRRRNRSHLGARRHQDRTAPVKPALSTPDGAGVGPYYPASPWHDRAGERSNSSVRPKRRPGKRRAANLAAQPVDRDRCRRRPHRRAGRLRAHPARPARGCRHNGLPGSGRRAPSCGGPGSEYNSNPPTSGPHAIQPAACGIYREPVTDIQQVHTLEHGAILVQYDPSLPEEDVVRLEELGPFHRRPDPGGPRSGMPAPIAVTSWATVMLLDEVDEDIINAFHLRYEDQSPEPLAVCPLQVDQAA